MAVEVVTPLKHKNHEQNDNQPIEYHNSESAASGRLSRTSPFDVNSPTVSNFGLVRASSALSLYRTLKQNPFPEGMSPKEARDKNKEMLRTRSAQTMGLSGSFSRTSKKLTHTQKILTPDGSKVNDSFDIGVLEDEELRRPFSASIPRKTDRSSFLSAVLTKGSVAYKAPSTGAEGYSSMVLENNGTRLSITPRGRPTFGSNPRFKINDVSLSGNPGPKYHPDDWVPEGEVLLQGLSYGFGRKAGTTTDRDEFMKSNITHRGLLMKTVNAGGQQIGAGPAGYHVSKDSLLRSFPKVSWSKSRTKRFQIKEESISPGPLYTIKAKRDPGVKISPCPLAYQLKMSGANSNGTKPKEILPEDLKAKGGKSQQADEDTIPTNFKSEFQQPSTWARRAVSSEYLSNKLLVVGEHSPGPIYGQTDRRIHAPTKPKAHLIPRGPMNLVPEVWR